MIVAAGANDIPVYDVGIFQSSFDGRPKEVWPGINPSPMMIPWLTQGQNTKVAIGK